MELNGLTALVAVVGVRGQAVEQLGQDERGAQADERPQQHAAEVEAQGAVRAGRGAVAGVLEGEEENETRFNNRRAAVGAEPGRRLYLWPQPCSVANA